MTTISGSESLQAKPDARVLLVEGEDSRVAASELLPDWACISIESLAIDIEWHEVRGRCVWCWPDAGHENLNHAASAITAYGGSAVCIIPPKGVSEGWNLANAASEGWTADLIVDHIEKNSVGQHREMRPEVIALLDHAKQWLEKRGASSVDDYIEHAFGLDEDKHDNGEEHDLDIPQQGEFVNYGSGLPFRFLGHDHGTYYYLSYSARQVMPLTVGAHSKASLIAMAGIEFWRERFPAKGKEGFSTDEAINWLISASHGVGVYEPGHLRGRGAWWDDGRAVMHCGNALISDGQEMPIPELKTRYVYESGARLNVDMSNPLTKNEANDFVKLCSLLNFERPIHARLLAGFCALAHIGGALAWRPHIYIVGESGAGKSWVMENIVGEILGDYGINIAGATTEAAIRQMLGNDALPVIFDDTDTDNERGQENMQAVLGLIRVSSSDGRSSIMKGGANGQATSYKIRSCFILSSIGLPVVKQADASRVSILTLLPSKKAPQIAQKQFQELQATQRGLLTQEYVQRFQARAIRMIPVIRENAKIFAMAAATAIGTQRLGDQFGALLAGAYSLYSDNVVTLEAAQKWINEQDWSESKQVMQEKDHMQCLKHIGQSLIRTDAGERQISELVEIVAGLTKDARLEPNMAYNSLRRYGIKTLGTVATPVESVYISNTSATLSKLLSGTPWGKNWGSILKRIEGAQTSLPKRGDDGKTERGTIVPAEVFLAE